MRPGIPNVGPGTSMPLPPARRQTVHEAHHKMSSPNRIACMRSVVARVSDVLSITNREGFN